MRQLLCDSGPLIATFNRGDRYHASCLRLLAERLKVANIATVDFKFVGMGSRVSAIKPIHWTVQEGQTP